MARLGVPCVFVAKDSQNAPARHGSGKKPVFSEDYIDMHDDNKLRHKLLTLQRKQLLKRWPDGRISRIEAVAEVFGIPARDIVGQGKKRGANKPKAPVSRARWAVMMLMYESGMVYREIGEALKLTHKAAWHGVRSAESLMADADYRAKVCRVRSMVKG